MNPIPLRLIDVIFGLDLLDPNLHALLPKADVLLLHLLRRLVRDIGRDCVCSIANEGGKGQDYEKNDKRYELREGRHG